VPQTCDIAILGATPAGLTAAYLLARKHFDVIVIDAPGQTAECPLSDWLPGEAFGDSNLPKITVRHCGARAFRGICYHDADLARSVRYKMRRIAGYFLERRALIGALQAAAQRSGATFRKLRKVPKIKLQEDFVLLAASRPIKAGILLHCLGRPQRAMAQLGIQQRPPLQSNLIAAALDVPRKARRADVEPDGMLHVVELPQRSELGIFFATDKTVHLRVISYSAASGNRVAELSQMASRLQSAGLLGESLLLGKARGAVWQPPAGLALDLETHVAKRCLLVGTAGGFADSICGQATAPSMRSAALAAQIAAEAVRSSKPQEVLRKFQRAWQEHLADSLRPPSTSPQMLLPLLFVNERIAGRFSRSLLYGEPI